MKGKNFYLILLSLFFVSVVSLHPFNHKEDFHNAELDFECTIFQNEDLNANQLGVKPFLPVFKKLKRTLKEYIHIGEAYSSFSSRAPPKF